MERKLHPSLPFSYRFYIMVYISIRLSFTVFPIWRCPEYRIFYVNWGVSENTDGNALGSLHHNIIWACLCGVASVFLTCFCLVFACFYQFLGLAAGSYQFYEECKFLLGTGLMKSLHPFYFPIATTVEVLLCTHTHMWNKGRGKNWVAKFSSSVSYLSCVVFNAESANNSNLSLFHSHHSRRMPSPVLVPPKIWV